ncbi:nucleotidyltransferase domain-containing protein [Kribbella aluminosa]|uniref:nucleotidyltransferase domain-containing protein n=1 Tax=Kribbella aluminosa TaxID=416017 RepID=UPI001AE5020D
MLTGPVDLDWGPETWDAWHPQTIAGLLAGTSARWWVVGGWALDLFQGRQTREHEDLEIATPLWDFDVIRERLSAYEFFVAGREGFWPVDGAGAAYLRIPADHGPRPIDGYVVCRRDACPRRRGELDLLTRPQDPPALR